MKKHNKVYYIVLTLLVLASLTAKAQNIFTNGDFESGASGNGFIVGGAGYSPASTPGTSVPGNYAFTSNPQSLNSTFITGGDHTTGTGKMMVVDGSTTFGLNFFWTAGSTGGAVLGFVVGKRYTFSYWIKSISNDVINTATQANINFFTAPGDIDPATIVPIILNSYAPLPASGWQKVSYEFTATDTSVLFRLYNTNLGSLGNDFAIDDMNVVCATPPTLIITNPSTVCIPTTVNLTLPAVTAGSDPGVLTYYTDSAATIILSNPNAVTTSNTYYIKNTSSLGCETIRPVTVTIAPTIAPPVVTTPINLCATNPTALLATPLPGNTLNWYGTAATGGTASSTATIPNATGTYFVSQINGVCESGRVAIQANLVANNGATILNLRCDSSQIPGISLSYNPPATVNNTVLFDWANNPSIPNSYNYSYSIQGGPPITGNRVPSNLVVTGLLPGQYVDLTLTSALRPCVPAQTIRCSVPCPLPLLKPDFPLITQIYCVGNTMPILNTTSPNGITGSWLPATISNAASGSYVFTPDPILSPCAESQTLNVTVNPIASPTFNALPVSVCQNSPSQALPTSSTNTPPIIGTWGPFASINTSSVGPTTYTFIPNSSQCVSSTPTTLNVTVNTNAIPTFNAIAPLCAGATPIPTLPTISKEGYTGTWLPTSITNTTSANYQFTPNASLYPCVPLPPPLFVTVTPNIVPTFAFSNTQCQGTGILFLPNTSTNTPPISGTWDNNIIDTSILNAYPRIFTPSSGSCVSATSYPRTITVYSTTTPTFTAISDFCFGTTPLPTLPPSNEGITGTWVPNTISNTLGITNYQFTPNTALFPCAPIPPPFSVNVLPSTTPTFSSSIPTDVCEGATVPDLPFESDDSPPITGSWSNLTGTVSEIDTSLVGTLAYTFTPDSGQCAIPISPINITVNPVSNLTNVSWTVTDAFTDNQIITVIATATGNYLYQLDSGPKQTSPVFENVSNGLHSVTVSDGNGCGIPITEDNILVIKHPKFFTPNGDNFNDTWKISGLGSNSDTLIYIYDRYGKLLKQIAADGPGWDGTYLGVPLPADDYWFTIDYNENSIIKKFKAHFSLKR